MKEVYIKSRSAWRDWLTLNYNKSSGIWLVFYKKHTEKPTLEYDEAVEEALCFGWIDSIIKKLDDERYARKLTPRKAGSRWSDLNKKRVKKLIQNGRMAKSGLEKVNAAKASGDWDVSDRLRISLEVPEELQKALRKNKKAKDFFKQLAPTYQKHFIGWIAFAKKQETKKRRVEESIALLEQGKKLGLK